jgi:tetratricopeptide (TPR) repeat protein
MVVFGEDLLIPKERDDAKRILDLIDRSRDKDPFKFFEVVQTVTDDDLRGKYKDLAKQYHPDTLRQGAAPELIEAKAKMFDLLKSNFEQIDTEEKRRSKHISLEQGIKGHDEAELAKAMIDAEIMWKKADALVRMRKYDEGLEMINQAVELKPKDTELAIYQIYYRFLANKSTNTEASSKEAMSQIQAILKDEPDIASGYLFTARLAKAGGKPETAIKYYKKLLEYDAKNHEAESEVRLATMRAEKEEKKKKKWL